MNFLLFIFYYFICTFVLFIISLFIYRFYVKHKCNLLSKIAEKQIEDYFGSFPDSKSITDVQMEDTCLTNDVPDFLKVNSNSNVSNTDFVDTIKEINKF